MIPGHTEICTQNIMTIAQLFLSVAFPILSHKISQHKILCVKHNIVHKKLMIKENFTVFLMIYL